MFFLLLFFSDSLPRPLCSVMIHSEQVDLSVRLALRLTDQMWTSIELQLLLSRLSYLSEKSENIAL